MTEEIKEIVALIEKDITPRDLLKFAKQILLCVGILFLLSGITELFNPDCGIFEVCKTILPPIGTLVIGFYFGKSN